MDASHFALMRGTQPETMQVQISHHANLTPRNHSCRVHCIELGRQLRVEIVTFPLTSSFEANRARLSSSLSKGQYICQWTKARLSLCLMSCMYLVFLSRLAAKQILARPNFVIQHYYGMYSFIAVEPNSEQALGAVIVER